MAAIDYKKASAYYIFSTASTNKKYTSWVKEEKPMGLRRAKGHVLIKGCANVVDKKHIITPKGVMTKITPEQMEMLAANDIFQRHHAAGLMKIETKEAVADKVAKDMEAKDEAAPLTPEDCDGKRGAKLHVKED